MSRCGLQDAGDLVASLHGKCLRTAIAKLGRHKEGLSAAARDMFREQLITSRRKKKLMEVDIAFHVTRHISCASADKFLSDFMTELHGAELASTDDDAGDSPFDLGAPEHKAPEHECPLPASLDAAYEDGSVN